MSSTYYKAENWKVNAVKVEKETPDCVYIKGKTPFGVSTVFRRRKKGKDISYWKTEAAAKEHLKRKLKKEIEALKYKKGYYEGLLSLLNEPADPSLKIESDKVKIKKCVNCGTKIKATLTTVKECSSCLNKRLDNCNNEHCKSAVHAIIHNSSFITRSSLKGAKYLLSLKSWEFEAKMSQYHQNITKQQIKDKFNI